MLQNVASLLYTNIYIDKNNVKISEIKLFSIFFLQYNVYRKEEKGKEYNGRDKGRLVS